MITLYGICYERRHIKEKADTRFMKINYDKYTIFLFIFDVNINKLTQH